MLLRPETNLNLGGSVKKLNKTQEKEKEKHSSDLFDSHAALEAALNKFNEKLSSARDFCEQIVSDMDSYESERSDKWQESDAGSAFQDWKSEWESIELEDYEAEFPEAMEIPENPQENLDGLPSEASS